MDQNTGKKWELFEKLPDNLKEAVFSGETADIIWNVCNKNNVNEIYKVAESVGNVLLGILPPENFQKSLEEIGIAEDTATGIARDIEKNIFSYLDSSLNKIYGREPKDQSSSQKTSEVIPPKKVVIEKPRKSANSDVYREPPE